MAPEGYYISKCPMMDQTQGKFSVKQKKGDQYDDNQIFVNVNISSNTGAIPGRARIEATVNYKTFTLSIMNYLPIFVISVLFLQIYYANSMLLRKNAMDDSVQSLLGYSNR